MPVQNTNPSSPCRPPMPTILMKSTFSLSPASLLFRHIYLTTTPHRCMPCERKKTPKPAFLSSMPTSLRNGSKRVGFSPHNAAELRLLQSLRSHIDIDKDKACRWSNEQQAPNGLSSSPARLLRHIKANVGRTLSLFSTKLHSRGRTGGPSDPTPNHYIPPRDSHQSEALEDCIEFINTSHRKSL